MVPILSLIATVLAIYGLVRLVQGFLLVGIGSLIAAALIGPAGISIFASAATLPGW